MSASKPQEGEEDKSANRREVLWRRAIHLAQVQAAELVPKGGFNVVQALQPFTMTGGRISIDGDGNEDLNQLIEAALRVASAVGDEKRLVQLLEAAWSEEQIFLVQADLLERLVVDLGVFSAEHMQRVKREGGGSLTGGSFAQRVIWHFFEMDSTSSEHFVVQRLSQHDSTIEAFHILAMLSVLWAARASRYAQENDASQALKWMARTASLLEMARLASTSREAFFLSEKRLSDRGRGLAAARHSKCRAVKEEVVRAYERGTFKSPNHASHVLADLALELSANLGQPLTPYNVQRTVYKWLLEHRKRRSAE